MTATAKVLDRLGFDSRTEVAGLKSIAHLFGTSKRRCGIYLLALPNDRFYIGQAFDVVRRFGQHVRVHERIAQFAFQPVAKGQLDNREKELIFQAERAGLTLTNVVHVSDIEGESDLDTLVLPGELDQWLGTPWQSNEQDFETEPIEFPPAHRARFDAQFKRFTNHPLFVPATTLLYLYLDAAIPYPRRTEYSFWSVSCLPSTNRGHAPRLLCVSASVMEVFCLGYHKDPKFAGGAWGFLNVASDVFAAVYPNEQEFHGAHPHVDMQRGEYRDAGQHQIRLMAYYQGDMFELLNDEAITRAAAHLCARLMRKRATIYSKFHCPQLADAALSGRTMSHEDLDSLVQELFPSGEDNDSP